VYATCDDNHCEGCGIPRHKRDQCQLRNHPDWNKEGLWVDSSAFAAIAARYEAGGEHGRHPKLKWNEYSNGGNLPTQRAVGTSQGRDRSKRTALRLTMQRTGRTFMGSPGRVILMSTKTKSRREGSISTSQGTTITEEVTVLTQLGKLWL